MSLTLIDGTVTVVTPKVAKSFEFLRSECERLNSELAAMTAAKNKALEALRGMVNVVNIGGLPSGKSYDVAILTLAELEEVTLEEVKARKPHYYKYIKDLFSY